MNGTTFNANVTNLNVKDLNILVGNGAASNASSDGAGLTVSTPNAQFFYSGGSNTWNINRTLTPSSNVTFDLGSTALTWSNVFANQVYGTLMTALQPNITANNANNLGGTSLTTLQTQITSNAATAYTNATTYSANASNLGNGTVAAARLGSGTANSTTILYGNNVWAAAIPAGGNTIITSGTGSNQSLTLSSNTIVANDIIVTVNGLRQTPNSYVVTSGTLYVTAPSGSDVIVQLAGGPTGATGATGAPGNPVSIVKQQFTGDGANTQFAVTGGYTAGAMTVFVNGVKQLETTDVITTSGANIAFVTAPGSNYKIDAFGYIGVPPVTSNTSVVSQQFTANGTGNTFAVTGGYTVGTLQVFVNGVKYVESSDVVTTSGANINFTTPPTSGSIIDVFGQVSIPALTPSYLTLTGGTLSGTVNVGSNVSITTTGVYINNFNTIAANYLLLPTDYIVQANNSLTLTLMAASTVTGKQFYIRNINTSDVNIVGNTSSETINGYANIVMQFKNSSLGLISTGSSWIIN